MSGKKSILRTTAVVVVIGILAALSGLGMFMYIRADEMKYAALDSYPAEEGLIEKIFRLIDYAPSAGLMLIGSIVVIAGIVWCVRSLSVFNEKDKVIGVITEVKENNDMRVHSVHPKKAVCTVTDSLTGAVTYYESAISTLKLHEMIGMNVPIYVNRRNPGKSFVDLENAYGSGAAPEGGQKIRDFRNL